MVLGQHKELLESLRRTFATGKTRPISWRKEQLRRLDAMLTECQEQFLDALYRDVGKSAFEAYTGDIGFARSEIRHAIKNLDGWMRSPTVPTPIVHVVASSHVHHDPLGVVLIIGPWNYPLQLILCPLVAAIAGGNCAVIKPSEIAKHTSEVLADKLPAFLDADCFKVVPGDAEVVKSLLEERFDHIFFTGSTAKGRLVMQAAAKYLTPLTLELGGKSPCIVDRNVDANLAGKRIVWGKFINAGQTCIAPDYVLVHEQCEKRLLEGIKSALLQFYGNDPKESSDFGRIVNKAHMRRLAKLIENQSIFVGGEYDESERYFSPTVLTDVALESPVMQEEIFGPILPVISVKGVDEAVQIVNSREKPLALYVFSNSKSFQDAVLNNTSSGGICINDTVSHCGVPGLPFGGVGASGMGSYHGKAGFLSFTHQKAVLTKSNTFDIPLRYPPYDRKKLMVAKWVQ